MKNPVIMRKKNLFFSTGLAIVFFALIFPFALIANNGPLPSVLYTRISVELKEKPIEYLLGKIEKSSNIVFIYDQDELDLNKKISRKYTNQTVEEILTDALPEFISYGICKNKISLIKNETPEIENNTQSKEGRISGTITDTDGNFLSYASIVAMENRRGTNSGIDGKYDLILPAGTYTLVAQYIGYNNTEIKVVVEAKKTVVYNFVLQENVQELDEAVVYGKFTRGQAKALNEQKNADNIKNVVSYEQFSKYADRNAAEALQRIPGIALSRDQGEGELISIRGLSPRFNAIQINGSRIPSPDPDTDRAVGLDLLQADLTESIVVNKTLTPDMDGDAIGGTVNFNLKQAPDKTIFNISASGGGNQQESEFEEYNKELLAFSATLGDRFFNKKLGLIASGSYYRTNRGSILHQYLYTDDTSLDINEKRSNDYDVKRVRYGLMFSPDFRFDQNNNLKLLVNYNVYDDDEIRRKVDYLVGDGEEERETRNRGEYQEHLLLQLSGDHKFKSFDLSYKLSYAKAEEDMPFRTYWRFARDVDYSGFSNDELTGFGVKDNPGGDIPLYLNRLRFDNYYTEDKNYEGSVDVNIPFNLFNVENKIKTGGKFRNKDRDSDRRRSQVKIKSSENPIPLEGGNFGFIDVRADDHEVGTLGLEEFEEVESQGDGDDYIAEENVQAAYVKLTTNISEKLTLVSGVRYERTSSEYTAVRSDGYNEINDFTYHNILPSAQFKYNFNDNTLLRLAYSTGFTRPSYKSLIPGPDVTNEDEREISRKNPELDPSKANNFDIIFEKYSKNLGVFSVGVFGKFVDDQILTQRSYETINDVAYTVYQSVNGEEAQALGVEVSLVHKFLNDGIPFLKWFGLSANYTYTDTEQKLFTIKDEEVVSRTMPFESPENIFNLGLFYDNPKIGFTFTASGVYRDAIFIEAGDNHLTDVYYDEEFHLDISASQKLTDKFSVFLQLNNLTNQKEKEVFGDPDKSYSRIHQTEEYGFWGSIGLRFEL